MSRDDAVSKAAQCILELAELVANRLAPLEQAHHRREIDHRGLSEATLAVLVEGLAALLERHREDPSLSPEDRERLRAHQARIAHYQATATRLTTHLGELSSGWSCPKCSRAVPQGVFVSGLRAGRPKLQMICRACSSRSAMSADGEAAFERLFGHLVDPSWNAAANGFTTGDD